MSILFAMSGVGVGLFALIATAVDEGFVSASGATASSGMSVGRFFAFMIPVPLFVMVLISPVVGAVLSKQIREPEQEIFKISFASLAAGTIVVGVLSGFLLPTAIDTVDVELGGVLINSILAAVFAGAVAAGGAWTMLNQYPQ
jgi:uncharacterized protein YacL